MLRNLFMSCLAIAALDAGAFAQTTKWSNPTSDGNGCPRGTSSVVIADDEIAWTFDAFGFELTEPSAASRFCRLSAVADIASGYYLAELKQDLSYSGIKSRYGSTLSVGAQSRFFGYNLPPLVHSYPNGTEFNSLFAHATSSDEFLVILPPAYFCEGDNTQGIFQSTLAANGQVMPGGGSAALAVQGHNVTFKATTGWRACPPH